MIRIYLDILLFHAHLFCRHETIWPDMTLIRLPQVKCMTFVYFSSKFMRFIHTHSQSRVYGLTLKCSEFNESTCCICSSSELRFPSTHTIQIINHFYCWFIMTRKLWSYECIEEKCAVSIVKSDAWWTEEKHKSNAA